MPTPARTAAAPTQPARHGVLSRRDGPRVAQRGKTHWRPARGPRRPSGGRPPSPEQPTATARPALSSRPAGGRTDKEVPMPRTQRAGRKLRRRRRGQSWSLWRVHDGMHPDDPRLGYLVTDHERLPRPIAFVPGVGPGSLLVALDVHADPATAAAEARRGETLDLRGRTIGELARGRLANRLLVPVDSAGRAITTDRTFRGALFAYSRMLDMATGKRSGGQVPHPPTRIPPIPRSIRPPPMVRAVGPPAPPSPTASAQGIRPPSCCRPATC